MVSPLQVAMAYAAIANDGVRMRPGWLTAFMWMTGTSSLPHPWRYAGS